MAERKVYRLWKHIDFADSWRSTDTSIIDDISASWFERRKILESQSKEYETFLAELKREHAIETGIVERMYDVKKGLTETLIKEGFVQSFVSHGDTNVPVPKLMAHLKDHLEAVDFVFDVVKENRELTIGFIKELHALVTRNQDYAEGRDQFGNKTQIPLIKGKFKERENNPTREDGTTVLYCPPEQVDSEMDNLVAVFNNAVSNDIHPIIISAWFHHSFSTIHPFQDGNGRVARLLSSVILIKFGFFPFTVLREEAKIKYIQALELADEGSPQLFMDYFQEVQKRNIQRALNLKEVTSTSFEEVSDIFTNKVEKWHNRQQEEKEALLNSARVQVFEYCEKYLKEAELALKSRLNGNAVLSLETCSPVDVSKQHYYYGQIIKYAKRHNYYFNRDLPKGWLKLKIQLSEQKAYQLAITIHHYGFDENTLAIGAYLEYLGFELKKRIESTIPLDIEPHVISIKDGLQAKEKNIRTFLERALTISLAQIASEI